MESDTLPYDGDGAAWDGWQVPAYQSDCKNQTYEADQPPHPAPQEDPLAPTIPYDTVCNMDGEMDPAALVGDATLAYEAGAPGDIPEVSAMTTMPPPALARPRAPASAQEAPTLAYGDTLVLQAEDEAEQAEVPEEADAQSRKDASRFEEPAAPNKVASSAKGQVTKSGLRLRLWQKQPPPPGYIPPAVVSRPAPKSRASAPAKRSAPRPTLQAVPRMVGCRVTVKGDGWGGGTGGYEATVVDADDLSLTIVYRDDDKKWKETHVLRQHCHLLDPPELEARAVRRRTI